MNKQQILDTVDRALNIDHVIKANKKNKIRLTGTAILFFILGLTITSVTVTMIGNTQSDEAFIKEHFVIDDRKLLEAMQAEKAQYIQPVYLDDLPEIQVIYTGV